MKKSIVIIFSIMVFMAQAVEMDKEQKRIFADFYRKQVGLLEIYPDKPTVMVAFVDLDADGQQEAIATSYEGFNETGWLWSIYKKNGQKWELVKQYDPSTNSNLPGSGVYARPGELFRLEDDKGKVIFVVFNRNYDKQAPDGLGEINKFSFYMDSNGLFHLNSIENIERFLAYRGESRTGIVKSFEVLTIEYFDIDDSNK